MGPASADLMLDVVDIAQEASERAGIEFRAGYSLRTAKRALSLLQIEWGNRGLNLWTIDSGTIDLIPGQAEYTLPDDTIDLIEHFHRTVATNGEVQDLPLSRFTISEYGGIPNKESAGQPSVIRIRRRIHPSFILWPVPWRENTQVGFARLRAIAPLEEGGEGIPEVPWRFLPALVAGLAYHMALKSSESLERVPLLKTMYEEQFQLASDEDRDRASVRFVPGGYDF